MSKKLFSMVSLAAATFVMLYFPADYLRAQSPSLDATRTRVTADPPTPPQKPPQLPTEAIAVIRAGLAQPVIVKSIDGSFARVGLTRRALVDITVRYPVAKAGHAIVAAPLDGGRVIAPLSLVVATDGMIRFQFQAGSEAGAYQVALHDGAQELGLHFWVWDEHHPEKTPVVLNSKN